MRTIHRSGQPQASDHTIPAGTGHISDAVAAIEACQAAGGKITNNSYAAYSDPGPAVQQAFDNSYAAGMLHVAAAGNAGSSADSVGYPARYSSVIAVAATDQTDTRASWSSTGPSMEMAGPGVNVLTTAPNNGYLYANGTSFATPHVVGVAALIFNCGITTNAAVRTRLQQTAQDLGAAGRDSLYGYGLVRADLAAMNCLAPAPQRPAAPSNLTSVNGGTRRVNVTWRDNSTNETSFVLQRCRLSGGSCSFSQLATVGAGVTAYLDTTVSRRTTYRYRVKARNSVGDSAYSNIGQVTTN